MNKSVDITKFSYNYRFITVSLVIVKHKDTSFTYTEGMGFLENLKAELEFQDITVKELSARTDIPKTSLDNYFSGHKSIPKADTAVKIAMALGVSVEFLVTGEDRPCRQVLPPDFQETVSYMKRLSSEDRAIVRTLAKLLAERKSQ